MSEVKSLSIDAYNFQLELATLESITVIIKLFFLGNKIVFVLIGSNVKFTTFEALSKISSLLYTI